MKNVLFCMVLDDNAMAPTAIAEPKTEKGSSMTGDISDRG